MLIIIILLTGCSNITKQARLDRFNQKLESKEYQISKKLDEDLNKRDENLAQLKKDISMLKRNTSDMRKNYHKYLQQSFKRHSKNVKLEGMVQLISYEVEMLEILQQKESKLNKIKNKLEIISSPEQEKVIKQLKKTRNRLQEELDYIYYNIAW